ncbi:MAG TPA: ABC transporter permease [Streptosporangiaceae bacterium]|jgi:peptide/nickel transport system permease protein
MTAAAGALTAPHRHWARLPFAGRPLAQAGAIGAFIVVAIAVFGPLAAPHNPSATSFSDVLAPPLSPHHLLGTDQLGRDVLSRLLYGARTTLEAGVFATLLATLLGLPIGVVSGYFRGALDVVIMRLIDVTLAFPFLLLAVGLAAISGPSLWNAVLALGVAQVPAVARIARGETLSVRELEYVQAALVNGERSIAIMRRHVVPNVLSPVIVATTVAIPGSIVGAAILSFLGLGVQPPTADWGAMLAQSESYLNQSVWLGIIPGLAIFIAALSFNLLGDGVRDALDPKRRR